MKYGEKIITAFAIYHRTVDLMKATGLSKGTVVKYKKDSELMELAGQRRKEMLQTAVHKMEHELYNTVQTLCRIRDDKSVNPQVRVSASNTLLNHFHSLKVTLEFEDRIEALEKAEEERNRE